MSTMGPRLILRADAGHHLGSGHVMRLAALAEAALDAGGAARLLIGGEPAASVAALVARGLDAVPLAGDDAATLRAAGELEADAIVLDGPHFDRGWVGELVASGRAVASLDDRGLAPLPTDVIINPGFGAEALADHYPAATRLLLGRRHHLLRREFRALRHGGAPLSARVRRVLVTMGGSDPVGATARVLAAVPGRDLELVVVLGPGFRDHRSLSAPIAAARARGHRVVLVENPPSPAEVLAACDVAISAAGGTLAELAYLGRPTYAVAIVDDQIALAARQLAAGLVAGGQPLTTLTNETLTADLDALLADGRLRATLAASSAATIDGRGPARILSALTGA